MRVPFIAGNWKMNKTRDEALEFIFDVNRSLPNTSEVETAIFAQAPHLRSLVKRQGDFLRIGGQNMHWEESGAFTGEISPIVMQSLGVKYILIGHSERREYFAETDEIVNKKVKAAFNHYLVPVICCGESLEIREAGTTKEFVQNQVKIALQDITEEQVVNAVIAYEPIWAIGTGKTCASDMADDTCKDVRDVIAEIYSPAVADKVRVLYGGSVKPANIKELMAKENIDGALIGGASLISKDYIEMANFNK